MSVATMLMQLGKGMISTAEIFFLTLLFSLPLGLLVSFGRMSKNGLVRGISKFYISIMRGTPLMLQLLVVYFAPYYLFGLNLRGYRFPAIILAFSINYAAYFAEIYRGGIESMAVGQYEAAKVLGYNKVQAGEGYLPCFCAGTGRNVYHGKADRCKKHQYDAVDGSRSVLLCV